MLLIAIGLAITFGLMNVINMAHGQFIMVGAYVAFVCANVAARFGGPDAAGIGYLVGIPASFLVAGVLGWLLERGLIRFLYKRPLDTLLATWGVGLVLEQAAKNIFGAPNVEVKVPAWLTETLTINSDLSLSYARLFILALAVIAVVAVYLYLFRTSNGRLVRAVMQNRSMADCLGVRTDRLDASTFAIGTGLAGLAGAGLCLLGPVGPFIGNDYIVQAFLVVVLGGVGQLLERWVRPRRWEDSTPSSICSFPSALARLSSLRALSLSCSSGRPVSCGRRLVRWQCLCPWQLRPTDPEVRDRSSPLPAERSS